MRAKRNILYSLMLMLLLIGGGGALSHYFINCCDDIAVEHHDCCHCEEHTVECENHRQVLDHECRNDLDFVAQYVVISAQKLQCNGCSYARINGEYISSAQGVGSVALSVPIRQKLRAITWYSQKFKDQFYASVALLRAPPTLV